MSSSLNISFEGKTLEVFSVNSEIRQGYSVLPQLVNKLSEVLANAIKKAIRGVRVTNKDIKLFLVMLS